MKLSLTTGDVLEINIKGQLETGELQHTKDFEVYSVLKIGSVSRQKLLTDPNQNILCLESRQLKDKRKRHEYYIRNREKCNERSKAYYQKNKEKNKPKRKKYYQENRERILAKKKQQYQKNSKHIREKNKQYYKDNRENLLEYNKNYRLTNKEKIAERKHNYYLNNKKEILEKHRIYRKRVKAEYESTHFENGCTKFHSCLECPFPQEECVGE